MKIFTHRPVLLAVAFFCCLPQLHSYTFSGRVVDGESGKPLPNSFVKVTDRLFTITNADGNFRLTLPDTLLSGKARIMAPTHKSAFIDVFPSMQSDINIILSRKTYKPLPPFDPGKQYKIKVNGKKKAEGKREASIMMGSNRSKGADSIYSKPSAVGISFRHLEYKPSYLKSVGLYIKNPSEVKAGFKLRINVYDLQKKKFRKTDLDEIDELLEEPIELEYRASEVKDGKWVKELPVPVPLTDDCMVEFQLYDDKSDRSKVYELKYDSKKSLLGEAIFVRMSDNPGILKLKGYPGELPFFYEYYREK